MTRITYATALPRRRLSRYQVWLGRLLRVARQSVTH